MVAACATHASCGKAAPAFRAGRYPPGKSSIGPEPDPMVRPNTLTTAPSRGLGFQVFSRLKRTFAYTTGCGAKSSCTNAKNVHLHGRTAPLLADPGTIRWTGVDAGTSLFERDVLRIEVRDA